MPESDQVARSGGRGTGRLVAAAAAVIATGLGTFLYLKSSYWAAQRIGDVAVDGFSYGELKRALGNPEVSVPKASSKVAFRLEPNITFGFSGLSPGLQEAADALQRMEAKRAEPLVLGEALDQAEVSFGGGIVRAGFHVGFDDPALMSDQLTAVWVRVVRPFRGSVYGIHLGEPCVDADSKLTKLGAKAVTGTMLAGKIASLRVLGCMTSRTGWCRWDAVSAATERLAR